MPLSVRLDQETEAKLRRKLADDGSSLSDFVRAAVDEKLARETAKPSPYELGKHLFGRRGSGIGDLAETHEQRLHDMLRVKHRR